jgi:hypothetical protein
MFWQRKVKKDEKMGWKMRRKMVTVNDPIKTLIEKFLAGPRSDIRVLNNVLLLHLPTTSYVLRNS